MNAGQALEKHVPGTFCWAELATTDPAAAKQFYTNLFGWDFTDSPMGPDEVYTMWKVGGFEHAAMYKMDAQRLGRGVPPHWMLYVAVEDADTTVASARSLGASILAGPFDVMDFGRMAVIQDPQRAVVSIWQPRKHIGSRITGIPGTLCWSELSAKDAATALNFYTTLFDWNAKDSGTSETSGMKYTEWYVGEHPMGGMLEMGPELGGVPTAWTPYFQVVNLAGTLEKARELGGKQVFGPMTVPGAGDFALIQDPQGAHLYVIELKR